MVITPIWPEAKLLARAVRWQTVAARRAQVHHAAAERAMAGERSALLREGCDFLQLVLPKDVVAFGPRSGKPRVEGEMVGAARDIQ